MRRRGCAAGRPARQSERAYTRNGGGRCGRDPVAQAGQRSLPWRASSRAGQSFARDGVPLLSNSGGHARGGRPGQPRNRAGGALAGRISRAVSRRTALLSGLLADLQRRRRGARRSSLSVPPCACTSTHGWRAAGEAKPPPPFREGRRTRWLDEALEAGAPGQLRPAQWRRLRSALALDSGGRGTRRHEGRLQAFGRRGPGYAAVGCAGAAASRVGRPRGQAVCP